MYVRSISGSFDAAWPDDSGRFSPDSASPTECSASERRDRVVPVLVLAANRVPPHAKDVAKRGNAAPQAHATVDAAVPLDAHFSDREAESAREEQQLDVERKAVDRGLRKQ